LGKKTEEVAQTLGEKTQQAAHTIGEKTQEIAHNLEEKIGYKFTPDQKQDEIVIIYDAVPNPQDLEVVKSQLKHTQTRDSSFPVIEKDVHIFENQHKSLLAEIEQQHDLSHVETTHDASIPFIDKDIHIKEAPQIKVLEDVTQYHELKHVEMNDKSAPVIPEDVHIHIKLIE
jgi:hypothetical protein